MDAGRIFYSEQAAAPTVDDGSVGPTPVQVQKQYREFIRNFRQGEQYIYREALVKNVAVGHHALEIDTDHLLAFANQGAVDLQHLHTELFARPAESLALFEAAAKEVYANAAPNRENIPDIHVTLKSSANPTPMRAVSSANISRLITVPGIVISATKVKARATKISITCRNCRHTMSLVLRGGLEGAQLPRTCPGQQGGDMNAPNQQKCPQDPFVIVGDRSSFVDQQSVKLQERPESVPTGEMPRSMLVVLERSLVSRVVPGTRVTLIGIWSIVQTTRQRSSETAGAIAIRQPYLRVVGLTIDNVGVGRSLSGVSDAEISDFVRRAKTEDWYTVFAESIAPSIYGREDIKKAIALLLVGGTRKALPDGMRLRGDINVLLLGDPGTAKSQMLKYAEKVAPVAVYTSGKGSSAAGLTASVLRDPGSRDFMLEGGAMVLADGGVVCIDEFDKMREEDRVAIHEAMEQQTISVAKAGITTILNTRTSVLAAANPVFGRYDDMRSPTENIDFQASILSRFDLIFIVRDSREADSDVRIARHVIELHKRQTGVREGGGAGAAARNAAAAAAATTTDDTLPERDGMVPIAYLKKFISYARTQAPVLSNEAAQVLQSNYVRIRSEMKQRDTQASQNGQSPIPITVRQLEAIIRISEACAKVTLSPVVTVEHVNEALRLFKAATVDAANSGIIGVVEGYIPPDLVNEVENAKTVAKRKLTVRGSARTDKFVEELKTSTRSSDYAVRMALQSLIRAGDFEFRHERKTLFRRR